MNESPLVQEEFREAYEEAELALINWMQLSMQKLPPAYIHLLLNFRVHSFLNQIAVTIVNPTTVENMNG